MDQKLPVMEIFYSLQGEGSNCGRAAHFVRLSGCSVRCPWCDVKQSWSDKAHPFFSAAEIIEQLNLAGGARTVVITGGEPLMHDLRSLCSALREEGFEILLETSGTEPLSGSFDWICLSPKKHRQPLDEAFKNCDELKMVIAQEEDFDFARSCAEKTKESCKLFLQSEWSAREEISSRIVEYIKQDPKWRLSLQTHKYLLIP